MFDYFCCKYVQKVMISRALLRSPCSLLKLLLYICPISNFFFSVSHLFVFVIIQQEIRVAERYQRKLRVTELSAGQSTIYHSVTWTDICYLRVNPGGKVVSSEPMRLINSIHTMFKLMVLKYTLLQAECVMFCLVTAVFILTEI